MARVVGVSKVSTATVSAMNTERAMRLIVFMTQTANSLLQAMRQTRLRDQQRLDIGRANLAQEFEFAEHTSGSLRHRAERIFRHVHGQRRLFLQQLVQSA